MHQPILIGFTGRLGSGKDTAYQFLGDWARRSGLVAVRCGFADKLKVSAARALGVPTDWTTEQCVEFCNELKNNGEIVLYQEIPNSGEYVDIGVGMQQVTPNIVEPTLNITGRQYLQYYGTEAHREVFASNFWVDALLPVDGQVQVGPNTDEYVADIRGRSDADGFWKLNFMDHEAPFPDICAVTDVRFDNEARRIVDLGGIVCEIRRGSEGAVDHASEAGIDPTLITNVIVNDRDLDWLRSGVEAFAEATLRESGR